uniref:Uncharacterized protein n=1 Tax=Cucumis sativus TaxID=3659 RepID=A0A0A0LDC8_CUCSA
MENLEENLAATYYWISPESEELIPGKYFVEILQINLNYQDAAKSKLGNPHNYQEPVRKKCYYPDEYLIDTEVSQGKNQEVLKEHSQISSALSDLTMKTIRPCTIPFLVPISLHHSKLVLPNCSNSEQKSSNLGSQASV